MSEKKQAKFYLTRELVDALRIKAAVDNETQSEIADRALRRELGMVAETKRFDGYEIHYKILGGNILTDSSDDHGTYDEAASIAKYADMCEAALQEAFLGAAVHVSHELNVSGSSGSGLFVVDINDDHMRYEPGDTDEGGRLADEANEVAGRVWESWEWVVYED